MESRPLKRPPEDERGVDYPRRRAVVACDVCRSRKSKCDGAEPKCRLCAELGAECVYRERGIKLDARDRLILAKLDTIENLLTRGTPPTTSSPVSSRTESKNDPREYVFSIPENHSTPWLHLFRHPKISRLLASSAPSVFSPLDLEATRPPLQLDANVLLDLSHTQPFVVSFFKHVNPFYAIVSPYSWHAHYSVALAHGFRSGAESVIVLLVLALGEASMHESLALRSPDAPIPGINFFATAWPMVANLVIGSAVADVQALMLTAAYLFYLVRPLQAWSIVSVTCTKLRTILLARHDQHPEEKEQFERVFWNALLFESDILAELDLPHSGIEANEDDVGLPSGFTTRDVVAPGTDNLWYFLAEIALRRLLNRVHHMLYSNTTSKMSISSFHPVVQELDFQLTQWYENLPLSLRFSFERKRLDDRFSTVLRLRYFACQSIIWRVYVQVALSDESVIADPRMRMGVCKHIESCLRQVEDLPEHEAGHIPYLWQGTLSIVSHIAALMAITISPALSALLPYSLDKTAEIIITGVWTIQKYGRLAPSIRAAGETLFDAQRQWIVEMGERGVAVDSITPASAPSWAPAADGGKQSSIFQII